MPSTATITSFYSFTANTKARASQVNGNFDVFRGHFLPIDPNTQTASHNTYDLGSTEYRWRAGYFRGVDLTSNTTTGNAVQLRGETSGSNGAFVVDIGGTEVMRITKTIGLTTTAAKGEFACSPNIVHTATNNAQTTITTSQISIVSGGKPVVFEIANSINTNGSALLTMIGQTTTALNAGCLIRLYVDGTSTFSMLNPAAKFTSSTVASYAIDYNHNPYVKWTVPLSAGTHTAYLTFTGSNHPSVGYNYQGIVLTAKEIY